MLGSKVKIYKRKNYTMSTTIIMIILITTTTIIIIIIIIIIMINEIYRLIGYMDKYK